MSIRDLYAIRDPLTQFWLVKQGGEFLWVTEVEAATVGPLFDTFGRVQEVTRLYQDIASLDVVQLDSWTALTILAVRGDEEAS